MTTQLQGPAHSRSPLDRSTYEPDMRTGLLRNPHRTHEELTQTAVGILPLLSGKKVLQPQVSRTPGPSASSSKTQQHLIFQQMVLPRTESESQSDNCPSITSHHIGILNNVTICDISCDIWDLKTPRLHLLAEIDGLRRIMPGCDPLDH